MKEKNWELLVLNEQVGQIGEIGVAPMVTVSLVNVQQDSLINKSEMVNEVQLCCLLYTSPSPRDRG